MRCCASPLHAHEIHCVFAFSVLLLGRDRTPCSVTFLENRELKTKTKIIPNNARHCVALSIALVERWPKTLFKIICANWSRTHRRRMACVCHNFLGNYFEVWEFRMSECGRSVGIRWSFARKLYAPQSTKLTFNRHACAQTRRNISSSKHWERERPTQPRE